MSTKKPLITVGMPVYNGEQYIPEALESILNQSFKDFEFIRWYLLHEHATVFTEDDDWYLLVHTPCKHLGEDNRCGIYETRPQICRDYDNDWCELDQPAEEGFQLHFRNYSELNSYCSKRFKTWRR